MTRSGRGFLIVQGIGLFVIAFALLADADPRSVVDSFSNAMLAPGALWGAGIGIGAGFAFAIWSIARPASSSTVVAWASTFLALPAFAMPFVWRVPVPAEGSLAAFQNVHGIDAVRAASIGTLTIEFAAMALAFAAVAAARKGRREFSPELGWRAIVIGLAGTFAFAAVTTWVRTGPTGHATFLLVVPGALSILALTAAATARGNPDTKDAWHAILLSFGAMVLAWSSASLAQVGAIDLSGLTFRPDIVQEITKEMLSATRRALPVLGPWLACALLAMPSSRDVWQIARLVAPTAVGIVIAATCMTQTRTALARAQHAGDRWEWPELTADIPDDLDCGSVPPRSVLFSKNGNLRLPNGDGYKAPFDWDGIAANVDAIDSTADVWLAVEPSSGSSWGDVGGLIDAVGRRRGPRGVGISSDEPMEGCAVRFVGRWNGAVACSDAIGIAIDGCLPGSGDEKTLHLIAAAGGSDTIIEAKWEQNGKTIITTHATTANLVDHLRYEWNAAGSHRDPYDMRTDHAVLELPAKMPLRDALAILGKVREVKRKVNRPMPKDRPAFVVSLALSSSSSSSAR